VKHPSEIVRKGEIVQAVILHIDAPQRRLSLGMKQLQPDAWETFFRSHKVGDTVRGRVCRAAAFGVFIELLPGVEGLCHNSEIAGGTGKRRKGRGEDVEPALPIGGEFDFKIVKMNENQKRIGLSFRALAEDQEQIRLGDYKRQAAAATSTVGDVIKRYKSDEKNT
jgi:small subunit ribosomal protein S1